MSQKYRFVVFEADGEIDTWLRNDTIEELFGDEGEITEFFGSKPCRCVEEVDFIKEDNDLAKTIDVTTQIDRASNFEIDISSLLDAAFMAGALFGQRHPKAKIREV